MYAMNLKRYLKKNKLTTYSFAKLYPGASQPTYWRMINEVGSCSVRVAKYVEKVTNGEVPARISLDLDG